MGPWSYVLLRRAPGRSRETRRGGGRSRAAHARRFRRGHAAGSPICLRPPPAFSRPISYTVLRGLRTRPAVLIDAMGRILPDPDRAILLSPEIQEILAASFRDGLHRGLRGAAHDLRIYFAPWGFEVAGIEAEVALWHGEQDEIVPAQMSKRLAVLLRPARQTTFQTKAITLCPSRGGLKSSLRLRDAREGRLGRTSSC